MLFSELLKNTPEEHIELIELKNLIKLIIDVAFYINNTKKNIENYKNNIDIQNKLKLKIDLNENIEREFFDLKIFFNNKKANKCKLTLLNNEIINLNNFDNFYDNKNDINDINKCKIKKNNN
jgi:hypothetical protein